MLLACLMGGLGLVLAVLAVAQTRSGRLSIGHGTALALGGIALTAAGLLLGLLAPRSALVVLAGALALALGLAMAHAVALTRLQERVRLLAQEIALLRGAGERPPEPPRAP
jgi:hypothetical protein